MEQKETQVANKLTPHDIKLVKIIHNHGGALAAYFMSQIFVDKTEIEAFEKTDTFKNFGRSK